jgi:hypothetical protein
MIPLKAFGNIGSIKKSPLFAVTCKLIACNIRRWAKSHFAFFKRLLQFLLDALWRFIQNEQVLSVENRFCSQTCIL